MRSQRRTAVSISANSPRLRLRDRRFWFHGNSGDRSQSIDKSPMTTSRPITRISLRAASMMHSPRSLPPPPDLPGPWREITSKGRWARTTVPPALSTLSPRGWHNERARTARRSGGILTSGRHSRPGRRRLSAFLSSPGSSHRRCGGARPPSGAGDYHRTDR